MSSYEEGPTETGEEKQYEMQELIVDFTDDGRILLEVKGVKVRARVTSLREFYKRQPSGTYHTV